jgi:hypothetical protein
VVVLLGRKEGEGEGEGEERRGREERKRGGWEGLRLWFESHDYY